MSNLTEVATAALQQATESLRRAEEEVREWRIINPTDFTSAGYLALSAEVTSCRGVVAGAQKNYDSTLVTQNREQRAVEQPTEFNEQTNTDVPELETSQPTMLSLHSLAIILSRPPKLFKFNTGPYNDTLQVPLKPIILSTLFWMAMLNFIGFCYTLYVVELFFLAVSCLGIVAVMKRQAKFLSHFCWARLIIDIIELLVDFFGFLFIYWDSIREGYVTLDEALPFADPISDRE
ncbi:hypothetical protein BC833DRAFT_562463 [Globomyces pollinis-pini]|nr:hypothetical protein BC833DRAFT_562463 [Globomyces pollinis-pini]